MLQKLSSKYKNEAPSNSKTDSSEKYTKFQEWVGIERSSVVVVALFTEMQIHEWFGLKRNFNEKNLDIKMCVFPYYLLKRVLPSSDSCNKTCE